MDPGWIPALFDALTVARLGSVGEAARRLGKTSPAVSQQLRRLTEVTGVQLFERRGRGIRPTAAAERLLPAATRLFDEAEAVFRLFAELSGSSATLRIAASDYLGGPLLVPVLRDLARAGSPLHFEISTVHSQEALRLLEQGEVEMAVVSMPEERAGLWSQLLFEQPLFWIGARRAVRGGRGPTLVQRLEQEPLLRLAPGSLGRALLEQHLERLGIRPVSTIDVPSVSLLLAYAAGGVGIGLVPALPLQSLPRRSLGLERADLAPLPVRLVMRSGKPRAPQVERFVDRLSVEAARCRAWLERSRRNRARA